MGGHHPFGQLRDPSRLEGSVLWPYIRFVTLFSIPADGVMDKTLLLPWSGFSGQLVNARAIQKCVSIEDLRCTLVPENITRISFLAAEGAIPHSILLHAVSEFFGPLPDMGHDTHHG